MNKGSKYLRIVGYTVFLCLIFYFFTLFFYRVYHIAIDSDYRPHAEMAKLLFESIFSQGIKSGTKIFLDSAEYPTIIVYPVWHFLTYIIYLIVSVLFPNASVEAGLGLATSILNSFSIIGVTLIIATLFKGKNNTVNSIVIGIVIISLLFVGPIDASKSLGSYYLGGYSGNVWHNPTYLLVRPIGFIIILLYTKILTEHKVSLKKYIFVSILLLISAFCKPNFYQSFLPGLVVYCVVYFLRYKTFEVFIECLKIAATCLPVGFVAICQMNLGMVKQSAAGGIGFSPFYVWKNFTPNWPLSLIVSIAFPLLAFLFLAIRKQLDVQLLLTGCMFLSSFLQYSFLYVKAFPFYGDFCWGMELAIFYLFVLLSVKMYTNVSVDIRDKTKYKFIIINVVIITIYFVHLICGVFYFANMWNTGNYYGALIYSL